MSFTLIVAKLIGPLADIVGRFQARKAAAQATQADWELANAKASEGSFKDELWTLILAWPMVAAFLPFESIRTGVREGFVIIAEMPEWQIAGIGIAWSAAFAVKGFRLVKNKKGQIVAEDKS